MSFLFIILTSLALASSAFALSEGAPLPTERWPPAVDPRFEQSLLLETRCEPVALEVRAEGVHGGEVPRELSRDVLFFRARAAFGEALWPVLDAASRLDAVRRRDDAARLTVSLTLDARTFLLQVSYRRLLPDAGSGHSGWGTLWQDSAFGVLDAAVGRFAVEYGAANAAFCSGVRRAARWSALAQDLWHEKGLVRCKDGSHYESVRLSPKARAEILWAACTEGYCGSGGCRAWIVAGGQSTRSVPDRSSLRPAAT